MVDVRKLSVTNICMCFSCCIVFLKPVLQFRVDFLWKTGVVMNNVMAKKQSDKKIQYNEDKNCE
eukprot:TRINITY_DN5875_c0_g1_i1.p1 TRINITY_DN5875_c0_g1~~TRINITY_DN5875_c0_g1_i1.p1  ORF type:complete len:64 (+),score=12.13 TRINITY_DN5875_c0_g1_i1:200-391(+)